MVAPHVNDDESSRATLTVVYRKNTGYACSGYKVELKNLDDFSAAVPNTLVFNSKNFYFARLPWLVLMTREEYVTN